MSPIGNSVQQGMLQNIHPMNTGNQALWSPHPLWPRHSWAFSLSKEHAELQQAPKTENKSPYNLCFYMCGLQCPPLCCDEWWKTFKPQETGTQRCLCDLTTPTFPTEDTEKTFDYFQQDQLFLKFWLKPQLWFQKHQLLSDIFCQLQNIWSHL